MITPIVKESVSEMVYNQILEAILLGQWPAGTRIPAENELARMFNVSRAPVREALQRLNAMGIISSQQGRGTFVNSVTPKDVLSVMMSVMESSENSLRELMDYRQLVEPYCAGQVAEHITPEIFETIRPYAPSPATLHCAKEEIYALDLKFHRSVVMASGNSIFMSIQQLTASVMSSHVNYFISKRMDHDRIVQEHYDISLAIQRGDRAEASRQMYEHIIYVYQFM